jgi:hypothetical protein
MDLLLLNKQTKQIIPRPVDVNRQAFFILAIYTINLWTF